MISLVVASNMAVAVVTAFVILLPAFVLSAQKGSECTTPNGETGTCISITQCKVIRDALVTRNASAVAFAKESQCGYDSTPLVCCGTISFKSPRGSTCLTPNEEEAKCMPLTSCRVIYDAVQSRQRESVEFAKNSQCGYDIEPLVCCGSVGSVSVVANHHLLPNRTICGYERYTDRVVGGDIADIGEFPWMVLLRYKNTDGTDAGFKCGGTMINNRYVLTAAHCVAISSNKGFDLDSVRLGEWCISTVEDCEEGTVNKECADPVIDMGIETKILHPEYNWKTGKNDIALLRIERTVPYTDFIRPICLPLPTSSLPPVNTELTVAGWGATENSSRSDYIMKVKLPLVSQEDCSAKIRNRDKITEEQMCAGGVSGKDSCQGDSGGPLMRAQKTPGQVRYQWYQEGVVSYGVGCGATGYPAIYTRVSKYIHWITSNLVNF